MLRRKLLFKKITMTVAKVPILIFFLLLNFFSAFTQVAYKEEGEEGEEKDEQTLCGGVERWSQKVLTDAAVSAINFTPSVSTISNLVAIATPPPNSNMARYIGVEDKTYSVVCSITIKKAESDNDYHLVLSDGVKTLIGEIPDPYCSAAGASSFVNNYIAARNFINANIASGNVYNVNLPPVVVYGVAFIDPPHGQTGAAPNNLEIHPILNIKFLDSTNTTTGIRKVEEILKVNVFPNPATDRLNIEINSKVDQLRSCDIRIFDVQGKLIRTMSLPEAANTLSTSVMINDLEPGVFFFRITKKDLPLFEGRFTKMQ
jgi:hypothetical protein